MFIFLLRPAVSGLCIALSFGEQRSLKIVFRHPDRLCTSKSSVSNCFRRVPCRSHSFSFEAYMLAVVLPGGTLPTQRGLARFSRSLNSQQLAAPCRSPLELNSMLTCILQKWNDSGNRIFVLEQSFCEARVQLVQLVPLSLSKRLTVQ